MTRRQPHHREAEILAALQAGGSNRGIARDLRVDPKAVAYLRAAHNIPPVRGALDLEESWAARVEPVEGGHLRWTGQRTTKSGTPLLHHRGTTYTAARIAFRKRTGRDPVGQVKADCGLPHCVAPDHVEDEPARVRARQQYRAVLGLADLSETCPAGHDRATAGRIGRDGSPYCQECRRERRAEGAPETT